MKRVVAAFVADGALQRLSVALEKASVEAADRLFLFLSARAKATPARLRFRRREISRAEQALFEGAENKASSQSQGAAARGRRVLFGREALQAKEIRRLLKRARLARGRAASEAASKALALLLPAKFSAQLQGAYRGLLFLSEMMFSR